MKAYESICMLVFAAIVGISCGKSSEQTSNQHMDRLTHGKEIYVAKKCAFCHEDENLLARGKVKDLTRPVIAGDTMFVQTHLKFVEASQMPPIDLTNEEIQYLSYYITNLHQLKHQTVSEDIADAQCAVCNAMVQKAAADSQNLSFVFEGKSYYFECAECLYVFQQAPMAYK